MNLDSSNIIDISPIIDENSPVFPGDVEFSRTVSLSFEKGNHLTLSSLTASLHIGSHADAPIHYHKDGESIEKRSLDHYLGRVQVIDLSNLEPKSISPADIQDIEITEARILFRTDTFDHYAKWSDDFSTISTKTIEYLASKGVITVGIDTPSVDPADSKTLSGHQEIYNSNMAILEGIDLKNADEGVYTLIALPLNIKDGDASPVRAILIR